MLINRSRRQSRKPPIFFHPGQHDITARRTSQQSCFRKKISNNKMPNGLIQNNHSITTTSSLGRLETDNLDDGNSVDQALVEKKHKEQPFLKIIKHYHEQAGSTFSVESHTTAELNDQIDTKFPAHATIIPVNISSAKAEACSFTAINGPRAGSQSVLENSFQSTQNSRPLTNNSLTGSLDKGITGTKWPVALNNKSFVSSPNHLAGAGTLCSSDFFYEYRSTVRSQEEDSECKKRKSEERTHKGRNHYLNFEISLSQLINEDIECDTGLAFQYFDSGADTRESDENDPKWLDRYADRPGITRWHPSAKISQKTNGLKCPSKSIARYRSRIIYEGISINLKNHESSAAAAAAQDLAHLALWGSEDSKPLCILSRTEAWKGLKAAGMPGVYSGGRVDPYCIQFTEWKKLVFEQNIERALSSIGGQDDVLAKYLSALDDDALKEAKLVDEEEEARRAAALIKERESNSRDAKRVRQEEKRDKNTDPAVESDDPNSRLFDGEHGYFEVDNSGKLSWRLENEARSPTNASNEEEKIALSNCQVCSTTKERIFLHGKASSITAVAVAIPSEAVTKHTSRKYRKQGIKNLDLKSRSLNAARTVAPRRVTLRRTRKSKYTSLHSLGHTTTLSASESPSTESIAESTAADAHVSDPTVHCAPDFTGVSHNDDATSVVSATYVSLDRRKLDSKFMKKGLFLESKSKSVMSNGLSRAGLGTTSSFLGQTRKQEKNNFLSGKNEDFATNKKKRKSFKKDNLSADSVAKGAKRLKNKSEKCDVDSEQQTTSSSNSKYRPGDIESVSSGKLSEDPSPPEAEHCRVRDRQLKSNPSFVSTDGKGVGFDLNETVKLVLSMYIAQTQGQTLNSEDLRTKKPATCDSAPIINGDRSPRKRILNRMEADREKSDNDRNKSVNLKQSEDDCNVTRPISLGPTPKVASVPVLSSTRSSISYGAVTDSVPVSQSAINVILKNKSQRRFSRMHCTELSNTISGCSDEVMKIASSPVKPKLSCTDAKENAKGKATSFLAKTVSVLDNEKPKFRRKKRCNSCENCKRDDCGKCIFCLDMRKFGGPYKRRQCCELRQCMYR